MSVAAASCRRRIALLRPLLRRLLLLSGRFHLPTTMAARLFATGHRGSVRRAPAARTAIFLVFPRGRLALELYLLALATLACTALFVRTLMFSLQYELATAASSGGVLQQQQRQRELLEKEIRENDVPK